MRAGGQPIQNLAVRSMIDWPLVAMTVLRYSCAYSLCATELQALDKAIADRELRRMASLREIYRRDQFLARRLEQASQEIIDGEFSEAVA